MITLKKYPNRDFAVLNLSDPQLDTADTSGKTENIKLLKSTIEALVEQTKPDLITISGDIHYGDAENAENVFIYFAEYIDSFNIPWSLVWGNHDNQGGKEFIQKIVESFRKCKNFCYEEGNSDLGNGNFVIAIEEDRKIVNAIIMMDTHDRDIFSNKDGKTEEVWGRLYSKQLSWYENQVKSLAEKGCNTNMVITHIPIYAYREAFAAAFNKKYDAKTLSFEDSLDKKYWNEGYEGSYGLCYEGICSYPADDGAMDLVEQLGATKLWLSGHDHINCFSIPYRGTRLMFALKTGKGCYSHKAMNGGTEIRFDSNGEIKERHIFIERED